MSSSQSSSQHSFESAELLHLSSIPCFGEQSALTAVLEKTKMSTFQYSDITLGIYMQNKKVESFVKTFILLAKYYLCKCTYLKSLFVFEAFKNLFNSKKKNNEIII